MNRFRPVHLFLAISDMVATANVSGAATPSDGFVTRWDMIFDGSGNVPVTDDAALRSESCPH